MTKSNGAVVEKIAYQIDAGSITWLDERRPGGRIEPHTRILLDSKTEDGVTIERYLDVSGLERHEGDGGLHLLLEVGTETLPLTVLTIGQGVMNPVTRVMKRHIDVTNELIPYPAVASMTGMRPVDVPGQPQGDEMAAGARPAEMAPETGTADARQDYPTETGTTDGQQVTAAGDACDRGAETAAKHDGGVDDLATKADDVDPAEAAGRPVTDEAPSTDVMPSDMASPGEQIDAADLLDSFMTLIEPYPMPIPLDAVATLLPQLYPTFDEVPALR